MVIVGDHDIIIVLRMLETESLTWDQLVIIKARGQISPRQLLANSVVSSPLGVKHVP